jgi:hypothetical protein
MPRGRNRNQKSKNGEDESDPTQTGQSVEIVSPSPKPCTSPRRGITEENEGMNQRDLSIKTQQRHKSPQRGTPKATEDIYPADPSRKRPKLTDSSERQILDLAKIFLSADQINLGFVHLFVLIWQFCGFY